MPTNNHKEEDIVLSSFTLEQLQEAVFWVNASGNIFRVNSKACEMTGYGKEELVRLHVVDLNPSEIVADFPAFWKRLRQEKKNHFSGTTQAQNRFFI